MGRGDREEGVSGVDREEEEGRAEGDLRNMREGVCLRYDSLFTQAGLPLLP